jgi:ubiquinone/menaquinone biosynthesis C-methylase UbiE
MSKKNTRKIPKTDYSKIAGFYDNVRTKPGILSSKIIEYGKIKPANMVLDFGCGTGRFTNDLSILTGCSLIGLEPSLEMLRKALPKDRSRNISWVLGDGQQLPFADEIFDSVYMTFVLHHLEKKELALQEIHRVLKKRGKCVIMTASHSQIKKHVLNDFPGVTAIDLKRFPCVSSIKKSMVNASFRNVHHHIFQRFESTPKHEYLERVKHKYTSTLTLFNDTEFRRRFKIFKRKVGVKYGTDIERISGFVFVEARK